MKVRELKEHLAGVPENAEVVIAYPRDNFVLWRLKYGSLARAWVDGQGVLRRGIGVRSERQRAVILEVNSGSPKQV